MQDTKRKGARLDDAVGGSREKKAPKAAPIASTGKQDRFSGRSRQMHLRKARSRSCGVGCNECERVVYEKVARSLRSGKSS